MVNKNYKRGRRREYRVCKKLREVEGYEIAQRSAGSHSPIDVWAINPDKATILLVQVKQNNYAISKKKKLIKKNKHLNGQYNVQYVIR